MKRKKFFLIQNQNGSTLLLTGVLFIAVSAAVLVSQNLMFNTADIDKFLSYQARVDESMNELIMELSNSNNCMANFGPGGQFINSATNLQPGDYTPVSAYSYIGETDCEKNGLTARDLACQHNAGIRSGPPYTEFEYRGVQLNPNHLEILSSNRNFVYGDSNGQPIPDSFIPLDNQYQQITVPTGDKRFVVSFIDEREGRAYGTLPLRLTFTQGERIFYRDLYLSLITQVGKSFPSTYQTLLTALDNNNATYDTNTDGSVDNAERLSAQNDWIAANQADWQSYLEGVSSGPNTQSSFYNSNFRLTNCSATLSESMAIWTPWNPETNPNAPVDETALVMAKDAEDRIQELETKQEQLRQEVCQLTKRNNQVQSLYGQSLAGAIASILSQTGGTNAVLDQYIAQIGSFDVANLQGSLSSLSTELGKPVDHTDYTPQSSDFNAGGECENLTAP